MAQTILNSEAFWVVLGFFVNTLSSLFLASKLSNVGWLWRAIRLAHGFFNRIDPVLVLCVLALASANACSGGQKRVAAPSTIEVATAAVNATDRALEIYIDTAPASVKSEEIAPLVAQLKSAAAVVRAKGDLCDAVALLEPVAERIDCAQCVTLVGTVKGEMECH